MYRTHAQKYFQKLAKQDTPGTGARGLIDNYNLLASESTSSKVSKVKGQGKVPRIIKQKCASPPSPVEFIEAEDDGNIAETHALHFLARNASFRHDSLSAAAALASTPPPPEESNDNNSYDAYQTSEQYHCVASGSVRSGMEKKRLKLMIPVESSSITNSSAQVINARDKWPQPSPAACGHRKKDEVDAATLLVNFEDSNSLKPNGTGNKALSTKFAPPMTSSRGYLQIINPEKLSSFSKSGLPLQASQPTTPFDVDVQDILLKEGPQLPQATPDSTVSEHMRSKNIPITPVFKEQINHDDPNVTLLHHAVIDLDYSLVANLIYSSNNGSRTQQYHDVITGPSKPYNFTMLHSLAWLSSHLCNDEDGRGSSLLLILGILNHMQVCSLVNILTIYCIYSI